MILSGRSATFGHAVSAGIVAEDPRRPRLVFDRDVESHAGKRAAACSGSFVHHAGECVAHRRRRRRCGSRARRRGGERVSLQATPSTIAPSRYRLRVIAASQPMPGAPMVNAVGARLPFGPRPSRVLRAGGYRHRAPCCWSSASDVSTAWRGPSGRAMSRRPRAGVSSRTAVP